MLSESDLLRDVIEFIMGNYLDFPSKMQDFIPIFAPLHTARIENRKLFLSPYGELDSHVEIRWLCFISFVSNYCKNLLSLGCPLFFRKYDMLSDVSFVYFFKTFFHPTTLVHVLDAFKNTRVFTGVN